MWKVALDFLIVAGMIVSGVAVVMAFVIAVLYCKAWLKDFEEADKRKHWKDQLSCLHEDLRYTESHPEKVWTCNDCGKLI